MPILGKLFGRKEKSLAETTALNTDKPKLLDYLIRPFIKREINGKRGQFEPNPRNLRDVLEPAAYGLDVKSSSFLSEDGTEIVTWHHKADEGMPTFVVFTGNTGHVGDLGHPNCVADKIISIPPSHWRKTVRGDGIPEEFETRSYRINALKEMQNRGAGFILVHQRGFGLSEGKPSEKGFEMDMQALMKTPEFLSVHNSNMIVFGESMGGSLAIILAEKMQEEGIPPGTLVAAATPSKFPTATADFVRIDAGRLGTKLARLIHRNEGYLFDSPLDSTQRIANLTGKTKMLSVTFEEDAVVQAGNGADIVDAARRNHVDIKAVQMDDVGHTSRDAGKLIELALQRHNGQSLDARSVDARHLRALQEEQDKGFGITR